MIEQIIVVELIMFFTSLTISTGTSMCNATLDVRSRVR
jgi:hypothetical protein